VILKRLILLHLFWPSVVLAGSGSIQVSATLPHGVAREDVLVSVTYDGKSKATACKSSGYSSNGSMIFDCEADLGKHSASFTFTMSGYKPYRINVDDIKVDNGLDELNLGVLHPLDAEEARIENIARTTAADGSIRFQITVNNLSKRQVLITELRMDATADPGCGVGHERPIYFRLSDKLVLTPSGSGKKAISATIANAADHPDFPAKITGTGVLHPCGHNEFNLSAPMNFTIPQKDYFEIGLIIPSPGTPGQRNSIKSTAASRIYVPTNGVIEKFDRIHFSFRTSDTDHQEISSYYEFGRE
jgi:hypothetical protein